MAENEAYQAFPAEHRVLQLPEKCRGTRFQQQLMDLVLEKCDETSNTLCLWLCSLFDPKEIIAPVFTSPNLSPAESRHIDDSHDRPPSSITCR